MHSQTSPEGVSPEAVGTPETSLSREEMSVENEEMGSTSERGDILLQQSEDITADEMEEMEMMNGSIMGGHSIQNDEKSPQVLLDQERYLPIANVVRIMKTQMDPQAKLAKDAKECAQECVSEFISFIASEAAEICNQTKRKTITADDLLTAMESTGFDNYAEPMRIFLQKYRQAHKITGPIHKEHPNYVRPKHFRQDQPVRPLFFDTEHGRRCTETQYVINGSEVVKNAPLADEWNEQTGTLNTLVDESYMDNQQINIWDPKTQEGTMQSTYESVESMEQVDNVVEALDDQDEMIDQDTSGAIALEQQGQMQIYVDPKSKQHYAAKETPNGMELYPLIIQDTPLQLENVTAPNQFMVTQEDGTTSHAMISQDAVPIHAPALRKRSIPKTSMVQYQAEQEEEELDDPQSTTVPVPIAPRPGPGRPPTSSRKRGFVKRKK